MGSDKSLGGPFCPTLVGSWLLGPRQPEATARPSTVAATKPQHVMLEYATPDTVPNSPPTR